ncbi:Alpha/Beta hydrolase protein [Scheffersomyces coipomensis]|uniref:Alpha/Beta hydrolase protein n=1 Tax=Scheffersomyces coipomensis TaxID=1788519 RepID=UPI00315CF3C0
MQTVSDYTTTGQFYTILTPEKAINDDKVIVFLHGLGSSQNFHYPVALELSQQYVCLLIDHEGAASSKLNKPLLTLEDLSNNIELILKETGLSAKKIILVGHSMSGMLINYINIFNSEKFNIVGNVLIGPVHPTEQAADIFEKRIESLKGAKSLKEFSNVIPFAATGSACNPLKKAFIRQLILSQTVEGYVANCAAIVNARDYDFTNNYKLIKKPTLIIYGEEDKTAPWVGGVEIIDKAIVNTKAVELSKVGHWIVIESPDEVYQLINEFVKDK